jgi:SAM-dependent methyltransferase
MTFWDERYTTDDYVFGIEPNDFLREVAGRIPKGPVLCLGEGEGRNAVFLAGLGHPVTAVDSSRVGLDKAARLASARGVTIETHVADLADFAIEPGAWSGIVLIWLHLPPPLRERVHAACVRGLAPGGALVLEAYRPEQLAHGTGGPADVEKLMTLELLRGQFAELELAIAREVERDVREGSGHGGRSATVQVLGFRPGT